MVRGLDPEGVWWLRGKTTTGVDLSARVFASSAFTRHRSFFKTAGFATIVVGLLAILGLAPRSGWLTRLAGALGIIGVVLFGIQVFRDPSLSLPGDVGISVWVCLAGAVVALIGRFFGARPKWVETRPAAVPPPAAQREEPGPAGRGAGQPLKVAFRVLRVAPSSPMRSSVHPAEPSATIGNV